MNRRSLLAGMGCGIAGLSGCTSSLTGRTGDEYESCNDEIIQFGNLPEEVKKEVRTAFDEGEYQTRAQLLYDQVEGSDVEALERDQRYYESEISERQIRKSTLSFEETTVTQSDVLNLKLLNITEETWEGTVTAIDLDGDRIIDDEVTVESNPIGDGEVSEGEIPPNEVHPIKITEVPLTDEYGEYEVTLSPADGESERTTVQIGEFQQLEGNIMIREDGIESNVDWFQRGGEPSPPCRWDDKKLKDGW